MRSWLPVRRSKEYYRKGAKRAKLNKIYFFAFFAPLAQPDQGGLRGEIGPMIVIPACFKRGSIRNTNNPLFLKEMIS